MTFARTATTLIAAVLWGIIGCHKTAAQNPTAFSYAAGQYAGGPYSGGQYAGDPQDSGQPDDGNLAPIDGQYPTENEAQQQAYQYQQQGAPVERRYPGADAGAYPTSDDPNAYDDQQGMDDAQAVYDADVSDQEATEPPPALPDYDQPPPPDPDYIWTPGYWAWSPEGYYWVPGAWVEPPYVGALWTPGYWMFYGGRYRFHHGFWGPHIGFYGGINYGYGYTGYGYYGGYWRGGHFYYNRECNHIDPRVVARVYDYHIGERRFAGRPSFNGPRGIMVRPRPAEIAVMHERRYAPLPAQLQLREVSMQNRQQFYRENHGRPEMTVASRPVISNHQIPSQLPPPTFRDRGARTNEYRQDGYRGDRGSWQGGETRGTWQVNQPTQPQAQPNPEGRVMPQQGRPAYGGQVQGQQAPQQQQQQDWRRGQDPQGRGTWQGQQPSGQTPAQPQAQPQVPSGLGAWQQRHGAPVQPQPQPQSHEDYRRGGWQGQAQPQYQPQVQPQPQQDRRGAWQGQAQPQAQPQPQQDRRGGWQGRGQAQPQAPPQQQPQFRRGPEGPRTSPPPNGGPQSPHGSDGRDRGDHR